MSKYTIELRKLKDEFFENMQEYPIFEESYREELNNKIYRACKFREIGYETPELFFEELREWLDLHMQEYNYLYKSILVELTPLQRVQIEETYKGLENIDHQIDTNTKDKISKTDAENNQSLVDISGDSKTTGSENNSSSSSSENDSDTKSNSSNNTSNKTFNSDFPQANLNNAEDSNYFSSSVKSENKENDSSDTSSKTKNKENSNTFSNVENTAINKQKQESSYKGFKDSNKLQDLESKEVGKNIKNKDYKITRTGNVGKTDFEILQEYRKSFMNVDRILIDALKKALFMNIW